MTGVASVRWRLEVRMDDVPGAMNRLLAAFAARGVSIEELVARAGDPATASLVFVTSPRRAAWFERIVGRVSGVHSTSLTEVG